MKTPVDKKTFENNSQNITTNSKFEIILEYGAEMKIVKVVNPGLFCLLNKMACIPFLYIKKIKAHLKLAFTVISNGNYFFSPKNGTLNRGPRKNLKNLQKLNNTISKYVMCLLKLRTSRPVTNIIFVTFTIKRYKKHIILFLGQHIVNISLNR
jgi:hypothetical protein